MCYLNLFCYIFYPDTMLYLITAKIYHFFLCILGVARYILFLLFYYYFFLLFMCTWTPGYVVKCGVFLIKINKDSLSNGWIYQNLMFVVPSWSTRLFCATMWQILGLSRTLSTISELHQIKPKQTASRDCNLWQQIVY